MILCFLTAFRTPLEGEIPQWKGLTEICRYPHGPLTYMQIYLDGMGKGYSYCRRAYKRVPLVLKTFACTVHYSFVQFKKLILIIEFRTSLFLERHLHFFVAGYVSIFHS